MLHENLSVPFLRLTKRLKQSSKKCLQLFFTAKLLFYSAKPLFTFSNCALSLSLRYAKTNVAHVGTNFVPLAVTLIWLKNETSDLKLLFSRIT